MATAPCTAGSRRSLLLSSTWRAKGDAVSAIARWGQEARKGQEERWGYMPGPGVPAGVSERDGKAIPNYYVRMTPVTPSKATAYASGFVISGTMVNENWSPRSA